MTKIKLVLIISCLCSLSFAQELKEYEGAVTYISAQNIYVKFDSTAGISEGDTLFTKFNNKLIPAVIVQFISSKSAAGESIADIKIEKDDKLYAYVKEEIKIEEPEVPVEEEVLAVEAALPQSAVEYQEKKHLNREKLSGRLSVNSYSNLSNFGNRGDYQRWRYSLSFYGDNISNSDFSVSSYINFSYRADQWESVTENLGRSLKIYDLAVKYEFDPTTRVWLGRKLNRRVTNISSIDGLQLEKDFDNYFAGAVVGSRPNFTDMGLNAKLFEFGGYFGRTDTLPNGLMESTIGVFQQTNNFKTDRRFIYLQHNNSLFENIHLFLSSEVDLYTKIMDVEENGLTLTSLFLSTRFAPSRVISFSASYDARKNVVYYETFKSFIDSLFENETRQGFRLGTNIRPANNLFIGLSYGYRFQKNDIRPSKNFGGHVSYSQLPLIETAISLSYNGLSSSYIDGSIYGVRLSKDIAKVNASAGYRKTLYTFINSDSKMIQDNLSLDLSARLFKQLYLNLSYEGTFQDNHSFSRILTGITARL